MQYTWNETKPVGEEQREWTHCLMSSDGLFVIAIGERKLYISTNGGTSWNLVDPSGTNKNIYSIAMSSTGEKILVNSYNKLYLSSNSGVDWEDIKYPGWDNPLVFVYFVEISGDGNKLFVGTGTATP